MLHVPPVLVGIIAVLLLVHLYRDVLLGLFGRQDLAFIADLAFVPARLSLALGWLGGDDLLATLDVTTPGGPSEAQAAIRGTILQLFVERAGSAWWTVATYALLHGSWEHLLVNMLWLLPFGAPVARRFGTSRTLVFFAATAAAGALFHLVLHPADLAVVVGASAAVSGFTAAAVRFAFAGRGLTDMAMGQHHRPAPPLGQALSDPKVLAFVAIWFGINLLSGLGMPLSGDAGRVAWEAHVGGFLAGLLLFPLFDPVPRR